MKNSIVQSKYWLVLFICFFCFQTCKKSQVPADKKYSNTWTNIPTVPPTYGLVPITNEEYSKVQTAPKPTTANGNIPESFHLAVPTEAFDQGHFQGSCASCASAMAKTIIDHQFLNVSYNNGITYSPSYLYSQAMDFPGSCSLGSSILKNLDILLNKGICKLPDMPYKDNACSVLPNSKQDSLASFHKIEHLYKISPISAATIKQYIFAGFPVIVGFQVDDIFANQYWNPANKSLVWKTFGKSITSTHATVLYGWDNNKSAFKMLNEWGSDWADNGSVWVDYKLVENINVFFEAYIITDGPPANNSSSLLVTGNLDFGDVQLNNRATKTIELKNNGTTDINISSITIAAPFSLNWVGGSIAAGTTKEVQVTFSPIAAGTVSKTIQINSNAANNSLTLTATGNGVQQPIQTKIISLSGNLSFGSVLVGNSSNRILTVVNNGNAPLNITSISSPNGFTASYSGIIPPGGSANVTIMFSPINAQSYSGNVIINSDATSGTNSISISGTGSSNGGNSPVATPAIGNYGACQPSELNPNCNIYTDGTIRARITNINTSNHQITFEIEKCNGTAFNSGGNFNIVSDLCNNDHNAVSYGFGTFQAGNLSFSVTVTDMNMSGTKIYNPFIVQGSALNIFYDAPYIIVTY